MRAKIGDVVIDRTYNKRGNLAIVVGEGISQPILIDHKGGITMDKLRDYFAIWDGLEVIGHIDLERIWEEAEHIADRKTEPQYSEDDMYWLSLVEDVANGKMSDAGANQAWLEYINHKTEPTISKMEQVGEPQTEPNCSEIPTGSTTEGCSMVEERSSE